MNTYVAVLHEE